MFFTWKITAHTKSKVFSSNQLVQLLEYNMCLDSKLLEDCESPDLHVGGYENGSLLALMMEARSVSETSDYKVQ